MRRVGKLKSIARPFKSLIFWKRCSSCNLEFRREAGWTDGKRYLCATCGPDQRAAEKYFSA